ncbi:MAG: hypothetical protein ACK4TA_02180 [Saprospiraceae bacterium]
MRAAQKTILTICLAFILLAKLAVAQSNFFVQRPISQDTLPIFPVFSGLSPLLVPSGEIELLFFNALSTQKNRTTPELGGSISRSTVLQHILQVTYGVSDGGRLNLGADVHYLHYRLDNNPENSFLKVWKSTASDTLVTDPTDDKVQALSFHTLNRVGLRFRWLPSESLPELTLQGGVLFPASYQTPTTRRTLNIARTQVWLQGNFYQVFGEGLYGFANAGAYFSLPNETQRQATLTPVGNLVIAKEISDLLIVFVQTAFNGNFNKEYKAGLKNTSHQWLGGLGVQLQVSNRFSISTELQKPIINDYKSLTSEYEGGLTNLSLNVRYISGN